MLRSRVIRSAAAIVAESPRETIAKNILKFKEIKAATTEAALAAAAPNAPPLSSAAAAAAVTFAVAFTRAARCRIYAPRRSLPVSIVARPLI